MAPYNYPFSFRNVHGLIYWPFIAYYYRLQIKAVLNFISIIITRCGIKSLLKQALN
jgi:hypothetical protein